MSTSNSSSDNDTPQEQSESDAEFEQLVRQVLSAADPVPSSVGSLAKLAFGFRDYDVVELEEQPEPALARSAGTSAPSRAINGDSVITWTSEARRLSGTAVNVDSLAVQTRGEITPVPISQAGVFETAQIDGVFRWVVDDLWATPWSSDHLS